MDGTGYRTIPGVGRPSIMDVGFQRRASDGSGHRILCGDRLGFAGVERRVIADGLRYLRVPILVAAVGIITDVMSISNSALALGRSTLLSFPGDAFAIRILITFMRAVVTSRGCIINLWS